MDIKLQKCNTCGYIGNYGLWVGYASSVVYTDKVNGNAEERVYFTGPVKLDQDTDTFDLDPLIRKEGLEKFEGHSGDFKCPICGGTHLYDLEEEI